jgi:hypothetical protein
MIGLKDCHFKIISKVCEKPEKKILLQLIRILTWNFGILLWFLIAEPKDKTKHSTCPSHWPEARWLLRRPANCGHTTACSGWTEGRSAHACDLTCFPAFWTVHLLYLWLVPDCLLNRPLISGRYFFQFDSFTLFYQFRTFAY